MSRCDSRESRGGVACVWGLTMGTPTPKGAGVEAVLPRMARVSQEWPWVSGEDTMDVPGVAMDDPRVAMGVPMGWS